MIINIFWVVKIKAEPDDGHVRFFGHVQIRSGEFGKGKKLIPISVPGLKTRFV